MIDWKRIEELREEIGADGFVEVADMFLEEAEEAVRALLADLTLEEVESQLHSLKGSALNLGLSALAAICQDEERKAAAGKAADNLGEVASVYRASRASLLRRLGEGRVAGAA